MHTFGIIKAFIPNEGVLTFPSARAPGRGLACLGRDAGEGQVDRGLDEGVV